jgi:hypothetical protein
MSLGLLIGLGAIALLGVVGVVLAVMRSRK